MHIIYLFLQEAEQKQLILSIITIIGLNSVVEFLLGANRRRASCYKWLLRSPRIIISACEHDALFSICCITSVVKQPREVNSPCRGSTLPNQLIYALGGSASVLLYTRSV